MGALPDVIEFIKSLGLVSGSKTSLRIGKLNLTEPEERKVNTALS